MGTWASAVTTAVAPVCWESKTFLTTVSGADSITQLPHQGYLIRTQPNNDLQAGEARRVHHPAWPKRVFILAIQAPFAVPTQKRLTELLTPKGRRGRRRADLRQGQDDATARRSTRRCGPKPDMIYLNGYAPDVPWCCGTCTRPATTAPSSAQSYAVTAEERSTRCPPR